MKAIGIHHVSLTVEDIERSRKFYGDFLGLEEAERPDLGLPGAWYQAGPTQLHLIQKPQGFDAGSPPPNLNPKPGSLRSCGGRAEWSSAGCGIPLRAAPGRERQHAQRAPAHRAREWRRK